MLFKHKNAVGYARSVSSRTESKGESITYMQVTRRKAVCLKDTFVSGLK